MTWKTMVSLGVACLFLTGAHAQFLGPDISSPEAATPKPTSPLALTISASKVRVQGLPKTIVIRLTNRSREDILLPKPSENCSDVIFGTLFFQIGVPSGMGMGCVADYVARDESIQHRIKTWHRLAPGASLSFEEDVLSNTKLVAQGSLVPGKYLFSASYDPPFLRPEDAVLLQAARIQFPNQRLETGTTTFKLKPR